MAPFFRGVAQLGSAFASGAKGRGFKSRHSDHQNPARRKALRVFSIHFSFPNISRFPPFDPRFCTLWGSKRGQNFSKSAVIDGSEVQKEVQTCPPSAAEIRSIKKEDCLTAVFSACQKTSAGIGGSRPSDFHSKSGGVYIGFGSPAQQGFPYALCRPAGRRRAGKARLAAEKRVGQLF